MKSQVGDMLLTWNLLKELMNAWYYTRDVETAKEQEFLHLKQRNRSVMEYVTTFNEFRRFAPTQVAIEEIKTISSKG